MTGTSRTIATFLAVAFAGAAPALADIPADGHGLTGVYGGSYVCADGEHGVMLNLSTLNARSENPGFEVKGELSFFPVIGGGEGARADVAGSFEVHGALYPDGRLSLQPGAWIIEPEAYGAAGLNGALSQREDGLWQITGAPADGAGQCSDFIATKAAP
ncbi:MAG: hypothetical protein JJU18_13835 [Oceanicaulis sp.]|nr:hypothetical protein [Oceanicaulis sp.]